MSTAVALSCQGYNIEAKQMEHAIYLRDSIIDPES